MKTHPYLRAYMAGIVVPTMLLLVAMTVFIFVRYVFQVPVPIERVIVFPMALVPNLFGVWNILYVWLRPRRHLPIGLHGALLPFVLAPIALTIATSLGFLAITPRGLVLFQAITIQYTFVATAFLGVPVVYYLVWKHLVGFFNELLGIA
ncbi:MAG: hypothetical protein L0312_00180 [Acidobacteria bacterium]|nr:hypothetical protein [Acidobacteriota bacterium]